jgi:sigma-B regulation protein RsbU (phosphoserine phosphatase)
MNFDLDQVKKMRDLMMPGPERISEIETKYSLKLSSYFESCEIMGGDFWGIDPIGCDRIGFYIVDCSGHEVMAALNSFRMHALMGDIDDVYLKLIPSNYLAALNRKLCGLLQPGQFATMFYGVMNLASRHIIYAAAGCTPPILMRKNKEIQLLNCEGHLLGVGKNAEFTNHKISFEKDDRLILYSDALTENINSKEELFGEDRLLKAVNDCADFSSDDMLAEIVSRFKRHRHGDLQDDLTINIYTRL